MPRSSVVQLALTLNKLEAIEAAHGDLILWRAPGTPWQVTVGDVLSALRWREQQAAKRLDEDGRSLAPLLEALWAELAHLDEKGRMRWDAGKRIRDGLRACGLPVSKPEEKAAPPVTREQLTEAITNKVMASSSNLGRITDNDVDALVDAVWEQLQ